MVTTVSAAIHDVLPAGNAAGPAGRPPESEKIEWIEFLDADFNDPLLKNRLQKITGKELPLLIAVGLIRGYQIWALTGNGDCEELISVRQGPVKFVHLLSNPEAKFNEVLADKFESLRPLLAVCDSSRLKNCEKL